MTITAKDVQEAIDRLALTKERSDSIDTFVDLYGLEDDAYEVLFKTIVQPNIETLAEAIVFDLDHAAEREAQHVPAFLTALMLTSYVCGYVTCLLSEETRTSPNL